jgi:hypothetical protein
VERNGDTIKITRHPVNTDEQIKKGKNTVSLRQKSRHRKALYLPMDRAAANSIGLRFRLALELIRRGEGNRASEHCMAQVILLTGFSDRGWTRYSQNEFP